LIFGPPEGEHRLPGVISDCIRWPLWGIPRRTRQPRRAAVVGPSAVARRPRSPEPRV